MRLFQSEPVQRVGVTVTFLRMERQPADPPPPPPPGIDVRYRPRCGVSEFRGLYHAVGNDHLWWLRRTLSDSELATHLAREAVEIHVLYRQGEAAGFYEIERVHAGLVNLNYFGLFPSAVGQRLGRFFLRHAVDQAWSWRPDAVTVNTCTADHPRALPTYEAAGFKRVRAVDEVWDVPTRLGLKVPPALRRT